MRCFLSTPSSNLRFTSRYFVRRPLNHSSSCGQYTRTRKPINPFMYASPTASCSIAAKKLRRRVEKRRSSFPPGPAMWHSITALAPSTLRQAARRTTTCTPNNYRNAAGRGYLTSRSMSGHTRVVFPRLKQPAFLRWTQSSQLLVHSHSLCLLRCPTNGTIDPRQHCHAMPVWFASHTQLDGATTYQHAPAPAMALPSSLVGMPGLSLHIDVSGWKHHVMPRCVRVPRPQQHHHDVRVTGVKPPSLLALLQFVLL